MLAQWTLSNHWKVASWRYYTTWNLGYLYIHNWYTFFFNNNKPTGKGRIKILNGKSVMIFVASLIVLPALPSLWFSTIYKEDRSILHWFRYQGPGWGGEGSRFSALNQIPAKSCVALLHLQGKLFQQMHKQRKGTWEWEKVSLASHYSPALHPPHP